MAEQGLAQSAPLEVGPAPGEEPPRKRLRHEDHEAAAQHQAALAAAAAAMPQYAHYVQQYPPDQAALEHLLRGGVPSDAAGAEHAHHQAAAIAQAQLQAQVQQAAAAQHVGGVVQGTPQDIGQQQPGGEQTPGYTYRNRARRKACEKPTGSSQIRQSFSKRKRGIAQKAYQLFKITDAKVFLFCANDKGASWAYATPGFGASLGPAHLKMMRQMAMPDIDEAAKEGEQTMTQIMGHPPGGEGDPDDRAMHVPPEGFEEDADGNVVQNVGGPVEGQPQPPPDGAGWSQEQLQAAAAAAHAAMAAEHAQQGGYGDQQHVPPVSGAAGDMHNGENLHYIADAAQAAYLGDHPERAAQHLPPQQQQQPGAAPPQQPGDYTGTTALGAPVELPPNGEAAHGVPVDMRSQPAEPNHDA